MPLIEALLVGSIAPLGPRAVPSGIIKRPWFERLALRRDGFCGDEQADLRYHGGPEKAVHHYPREHYATWCDELGPLPVLSKAGAFGENLSTSGLTEADVAVGDSFRIGTAVVQVSQGRQPCWKLNARLRVRDVAKRVQSTGRTGWYYRVLEEGHVAAGDEMVLVDRLAPEWTVERLWQNLSADAPDLAQLSEMANLAVLAEPWRSQAARRVVRAGV